MLDLADTQLGVGQFSGSAKTHRAHELHHKIGFLDALHLPTK
jgi:hypothetical protein